MRMHKWYLRVDPKPGWAYRTGSEGGNSGAPKLQLFGVSKNAKNTNFLGGLLNNPSVESVAGKHTTLSPKHFPLSFTRDRFLPGITYFLADFMCRFRTRSPMFACEGLVLAWEWLERTLGVLGLRVGSVISWVHGIIWWYEHIILWYDHAILWDDHVILWYDHILSPWWYDHIILWYDFRILRYEKIVWWYGKIITMMIYPYGMVIW